VSLCASEGEGEVVAQPGGLVRASHPQPGQRRARSPCMRESTQSTYGLPAEPRWSASGRLAHSACDPTHGARCMLQARPPVLFFGLWETPRVCDRQVDSVGVHEVIRFPRSAARRQGRDLPGQAGCEKRPACACGHVLTSSPVHPPAYFFACGALRPSVRRVRLQRMPANNRLPCREPDISAPGGNDFKRCRATAGG